MRWGDVDAVVVQCSGSIALVSSIAVSIAQLSREERVRRRLKADSQVLASLEGRPADLMREVVGADVARLHALVFHGGRRGHSHDARDERPTTTWAVRAAPTCFVLALLFTVAAPLVDGAVSEISLIVCAWAWYLHATVALLLTRRQSDPPIDPH